MGESQRKKTLNFYVQDRTVEFSSFKPKTSLQNSSLHIFCMELFKLTGSVIKMIVHIILDKINLSLF